MCDKRFMLKNRSNVGKNVTINRCIQLSSPFQLLKKTVRGPRHLCAKAGRTNKFS